MYHSRVSSTSWRLGEFRVNHRQRHAVKRQVPRGEPRIFPFVRHGNHVGVVQMLPVVVAAVLAFRRRRRLGRIALQPFRHVVVIKLFAPDHARERLALHQPRVGIGDVLLQAGVKFVGLACGAGRKCASKSANGLPRRRAAGLREPQPHGGRAARRHGQLVKRAGLGAGLRGIHRRPVSGDHIFMKRVLEKTRRLSLAEEPADIGFVVAKQAASARRRNRAGSCPDWSCSIWTPPLSGR